MALVTRLSRLFQADVHAVLDRIEEPDLQLRQAVREMQLALDQDRQRVKLLQHEAAQLTKAIADCERALQAFDEELDICLAAKKDDLARDLVRRKLATAHQLQSLNQRTETVATQVEALEHQIEEQAQQLAGMQFREPRASHRRWRRCQKGPIRSGGRYYSLSRLGLRRRTIPGGRECGHEGPR